MVKKEVQNKNTEGRKKRASDVELKDVNMHLCAWVYFSYPKSRKIIHLSCFRPSFLFVTACDKSSRFYAEHNSQPHAYSRQYNWALISYQLVDDEDEKENFIPYRKLCIPAHIFQKERTTTTQQQKKKNANNVELERDIESEEKNESQIMPCIQICN